MKKNAIFLLAASWSLLAASCYEDRSTPKTVDIPAVEITVPEAIDTEISVVFGSLLDVTGVTITRGGKADPDGLEYLWTASRAGNDSEAIELATTKEFHEVIELPILASGYLFVLTVTDPEYGLQYQYKWILRVTAPYNEGIVAAYTTDGVTSDLALITHPQLTYTYSGDPQGAVFTDMIATRNKVPFPSPVTHVLYSYNKGTNYDMLWVATGDDLMRVETNYYEINADKDYLFVSPPAAFGIKGIYNTIACTMFVNADGIYEIPLSRDRLPLPLITTREMTIDNGVVAAHTGTSAASRPSTVFYDSRQGLFCSGFNATFTKCSDASDSGDFNPGNIPGLSSIAGGFSDSHLTMLMLNGNDGAYKDKYQLYTFTSSGSANAKGGFTYTLPEECYRYIEDAVDFVFSFREPVLYIVTPQAIYRLLFTATSSINFYAEPVFTAPGGETITQADLYVQGYFAWEAWETATASNANLEWNTRALTVATSKGTTGRVYVVPQTEFGTGKLDQPNALEFDIPGRILDVTVSGIKK